MERAAEIVSGGVGQFVQRREAERGSSSRARSLIWTNGNSKPNAVGSNSRFGCSCRERAYWRAALSRRTWVRRLRLSCNSLNAQVSLSRWRSKRLS